MKGTYGFFLAGLILGAAAAAIVVLALTGGGGKKEDLERRVASLETERARLERELAARPQQDATIRASNLDDLMDDLTEEPPPVIEEESEPIEDPVTRDEPAPAELTDEQLEVELRALGAHLQSHFLGTSDEFRIEVQDILKRGGPETVAKIIEAYGEVEGLGPKTVLAHVLAQTDDPEALRVLKEVARDTSAGMIERRTASHGLAFSDREGLEDFYREIAENPDNEPGIRGNAAYGLARRSDEGIELYAKQVDAAYERRDSLAIAYLQGFALLGKRAAPAIEKRLATIRDEQSRIMLVEILAENGRKESIPALRQLADDPDISEEIRKRAEKAAAKLASGD